jgi:peroxiredoxin
MSPLFSMASKHAVSGMLLTGVLTFLSLAPAMAAQGKPEPSEQEKQILTELRGLRNLDDTTRAQTTKGLALEIRQLPPDSNKVHLAGSLAMLSTEGDFGRDTLQEVTTTLATALRETPPPVAKPGTPNMLFVELASLVRYEHMQAQSDNPQFAQAMATLAAADAVRQNADFTLTDLQGKAWHLRDLRGKVVLVNFWATWCPPCRKEMPDLEALYEKYKDQGFVVLAISDEEEAKVAPFIAERKINYPVALDPDSKVHQLYQVEGIPKSFVYDRDGKLVAQSIDMRTRGQFQQMLAQAGLQ